MGGENQNPSAARPLKQKFSNDLGGASVQLSGGFIRHPRRFKGHALNVNRFPERANGVIQIAALHA
jgi:hypothetical protein